MMRTSSQLSTRPSHRAICTFTAKSAGDGMRVVVVRGYCVQVLCVNELLYERTLVCVCVCVCVRMWVWVCVFL